MQAERYVLDEYFLKDKFKLKHRDIFVFLSEKAGRLAREYIITESPLLPAQKKPLSLDLLSRLIERIRTGRYRQISLLSGERAIFQIRDDEWSSLALELTQGEYTDLRGQLVANGYPRNLIVSERELEMERRGGMGKEYMRKWGVK